MGDFASGIKNKIKLLEKEGIEIVDGKIGKKYILSKL